ncbi:MAG: 30S ribosomal protein S4 [Thermoproteota archaeon]|nr:MAG: 30S ribosomal protein S4 [Candidatus Korarchaeota archaeon]
MGDPKQPRKKYRRPRKPWDKQYLEWSIKLVGEYGLRNKRELLRAHHEASRVRRLARILLSHTEGRDVKLEEQLLSRLKRLGIIPGDAVLDDVLDVTAENFLRRRLQTLVYLKEYARTPYQARQLVVHGHVRVNGRIVKIPSYLVSVEEENTIEVDKEILDKIMGEQA